jgi:carbon storage regulator
MLVLTRRIGEEILIDKGQIQIKILYVRKGHVAVGINAPSKIDVDRKEIYLRKRAIPQGEAQQEIISETN